MIKIEVFRGPNKPITIIAEGNINDFFEWSNRSKIVGVVEKDTKALFTIPILRYPVRVEELETCNCDNEKKCDCDNCNKENE